MSRRSGGKGISTGHIDGGCRISSSHPPFLCLVE